MSRQTSTRFSFLLNLTSSASLPGGTFSYAWLSDGTKVSARADDGSGHGVQKRYLGSFVYSNNTDLSTDRPTEVESIAWDEGRLFFDLSAAVEEVAEPGVIDPDLVPEMQEFPDEPIDSVDVDVLGLYRDCLFATDHLGNVRTVIDITTDLVSPSIVEQNNYLPFGSRLPLTDPAYDFGNRWRYAAKEEQRFGPADLGLLDFGARMYDPFTARWPSPDPMAAKYPGHSPFNYCEGNPMNILDYYGETNYRFNDKGYCTVEVTDDPFDIVFAGDDYFLLYNSADRDFMKSFSSQNESTFSYTISASETLMKLFFFLADNTKVEWVVHSFSNGEAILGTKHKDGSSGSVTDYISLENAKNNNPSLSEDNQISKIHSHPNEPTDIKNELETMGYPNSPYYSNDYDNYKRQYELLGKKTPTSKVYFPNSKRIYQIRYSEPQIIGKR